MVYAARYDAAIDAIGREGRHRIFADIKRRRGGTYVDHADPRLFEAVRAWIGRLRDVASPTGP